MQEKLAGEEPSGHTPLRIGDIIRTESASFAGETPFLRVLPAVQQHGVVKITRSPSESLGRPSATTLPAANAGHHNLSRKHEWAHTYSCNASEYCCQFRDEGDVQGYCVRWWCPTDR